MTLAKHVVHRSRPPPDLRLVSAHGWSWPSGHTAAAIVVFATVALVVTAIAPNPAYRVFAWVLAALAVGAVAFSRIELGVHWSTDVIASTVFVATWLLVLLQICSRPRSVPIELAAEERVTQPWQDEVVQSDVAGVALVRSEKTPTKGINRIDPVMPESTYGACSRSASLTEAIATRK